MERDALLSLVVPAELEKLPAATVTLPLSVLSTSGVNTTVYSVALMASKSETTPPETVRSSAVKSVEPSERVNVIRAVSPNVRLVSSVEIEIVGATISASSSLAS